MTRDLYEVRVGAYIFNGKDEMLFLLNNDNTWGILGGHMEKGEQIEETLHREIKEETNLEVDMIKMFDVTTVHHVNSLVLGFACKYKSGTVILQEEEVKDYKWVQIEKMNEFELTFPLLPEMATKALEIINTKN